jgi:hypothetical protein
LECLVDARRHGDDGLEARMRRQTADLKVRRLAAREIRRAGS